MDQSWLDIAAVSLQSPQESRYDPIHELLASSVIFGPGTVGLVVILDDILQLMGEGFGLTLLPCYRTFHLATCNSNRKTENPIRRCAVLVELCYLRHEVDWLRRGREIHIMEVSEKEVYMRFTVVIISPCRWFRYQS